MVPRSGDDDEPDLSDASQQVVGFVYDELRRLARAQMNRESPDHTLQPTALVHEAYLRLVRNHSMKWENRAHFLTVAATEMRRVLVEHARKKSARKRGGDRTRVEWQDELAPAAAGVVDVLALDEALRSLATRNPRQARVAELRLFAGLEVSEVARVEGVSERTIKHDWQFARAFLARALG